jgi:energy-coupling factor transporter ATP-binding protein EcfA2
MGPFYGRKAIVDDLIALMLKGQIVLLYGPMGIGKTAILEAVRRAIEKDRRPCGFSPQTRSLSDLTAALIQAYPDVNIVGQTQRQIRSALRLAIENNPGVLLCDHLCDAGTQFKGYLRSLRWTTALGVLFAAHAEVPRDHERFRSMHLAYREMEVHPLPSRYMHRIFADTLSGKSLPGFLTDKDRSALVRVAHGRPGWMSIIGELLQRSDFWIEGHVHIAFMRISVMAEIAKRYFVCTNDKLEAGN